MLLYFRDTALNAVREWTKMNKMDSLCKSCCNFDCEMQSGIYREKCEFYISCYKILGMIYDIIENYDAIEKFLNDFNDENTDI